MRHKIALTSELLACRKAVKDKMLQGRNILSSSCYVHKLLLLPLGGILRALLEEILKDVGDAENRLGILGAFSNCFWHEGGVCPISP